MFVSRRRRYTAQEAREAIAASLSFSDALRRLGMRPAGGNHRTLKLLAERLGVPTDHFDPHAAQREALRAASRPIPLEDILVRGSTYNRYDLKRRLYAGGLKERACELCGQGEIWRGRQMSLILEYINGEATDHLLENLRIVCPNCAATLDTHCGKALRRPRTARACQGCGALFVSDNHAKRYCSHGCYASTVAGVPRPDRRTVPRPPLAHLLAAVDAHPRAGAHARARPAKRAASVLTHPYARATVEGDPTGRSEPVHWWGARLGSQSRARHERPARSRSWRRRAFSPRTSARSWPAAP